MQLDNLVGKRVRMSRKYIDRWVLNHQNWECHQSPNSGDQVFSDSDYDQEVLLAMFTLMGAPVLGFIKGTGYETFLCYFNYAGCSHWSYLYPEDLEFFD